jgi:two-component system response regulator RegA
MSNSLPSTRSHDQALHSALIIDDESFGASLTRSFDHLGLHVWWERDFESARQRLVTVQPDLVVMELKIGCTWAFDLIQALRTDHPGMRLAVVTAYPSVATTVRAMRCGADGYLAKPTEAATILATVGACAGSPPVPANELWPSLDRTIWEYLNQVYMAAGTLSEAARRLRIDRRSLRRMMNKFPPRR